MAPSSQPPQEPARGLELRRFFYAIESDDGLAYDNSGFLKPDLVVDLLRPEDLLRFQCVLVTAPPWTGKTYVAKGIFNWLHRQGSAVIARGRVPESVRSALTPLEDFVSGDSLEPPWWQEWTVDTTNGVWIVDALDEGYERERGIPFKIVQMIQSLSCAQRERLRLIILSRDYDVVAVVQNELQPLYEGQHDAYKRLVLAPLDRVEANNLVGPRRSINNVV